MLANTQPQTLQPQSSNLPLEVEYSLIQPAIREENRLKLALGLGASSLLLCCILLSNYLPKAAKTMMLFSSLGASIGLNAVSASQASERRAKIAQGLSKMQQEHQERVYAAAYGLHSNLLEIEAEHRLFQALQQLPAHQRNFYAAKFGVAHLAEPLTVEAQIVDDPFSGSFSGSNLSIEKYISPSELAAKGDISWIKDIVSSMVHPDPSERKYHHLRFCGATQSGKSTLFSKILEMILILLEKTGQDAIVNLIDPKYPCTKWSITPSFKGFNQVFAGINAGFSLLNQRKKAWVDAIENDQEIPKFPEYFMVVDEIDIIYSGGQGHPEVGKDPLRQIMGWLHTILKEGAAYRIHLIMIGQSPLSGACGFTRPDLGNFCSFLLANTGLQWLNDREFEPREIAPELKAQLSDLIREEIRCVLVCPNSAEPKVHVIPKFKIADKQLKASNTKVAQKSISDAPDPWTEESQDPQQSAQQGLDQLLHLLTEWIKTLGHLPDNKTLKSKILELSELDESQLDDESVEQIKNLLIARNK